MKSFRYFYLLAALMAFSACGDDGEVSQEQDLVTNGGKVLINAVVEPNSLFTRSNPMGEDDAQQGAFNQGDKLAISCGDDAPVIYTMGSDKIWTAGENSLMWSDSGQETVLYKAYYPVGADASFDTFVLPADQSTSENIANADYMTTKTVLLEKAADGVLKLNMHRRTARVIINILGVEEKLGDVKSLNIYSQYSSISSTGAEGPVKPINPYKAEDIYTALVLPGEGSDAEGIFVRIETTSGGTQEVKGIKPVIAGKSYTYNVYVGENNTTISGTTVEDWTTSILGGTLITMKPLDRSEWSVTGKFEEGRWNFWCGKFANAIDGDLHRFWASDWDGPNAKDLPPVLVIDTKKLHLFGKIGIIVRDDLVGQHNYTLKCYVSSDPRSWWKSSYVWKQESDEFWGSFVWEDFGWKEATNWENRENWIPVSEEVTLKSLHNPAIEYIRLNDLTEGHQYFIIEFTDRGARGVIEIAEVYLYGREAAQ